MYVTNNKFSIAKNLLSFRKIGYVSCIIDSSWEISCPLLSRWPSRYDRKTHFLTWSDIRHKLLNIALYNGLTPCPDWSFFVNKHQTFIINKLRIELSLFSILFVKSIKVVSSIKLVIITKVVLAIFIQLSHIFNSFQKLIKNCLHFLLPCKRNPFYLLNFINDRSTDIADRLCLQHNY